MVKYGIYYKRAMPDCLRLYYKDGGTATLDEKIKWCQDVADVFEYVHQNNRYLPRLADERGSIHLAGLVMNGGEFLVGVYGAASTARIEQYELAGGFFSAYGNDPTSKLSVGK
ncbi:hypothetical protein BKA61DRAFT_742451 [Leptodontidium sp. MPI-SDFR-AT-0119]|nr:hypothetical protein BKA61DRAFT_742451 [Leptodontidium sp. MPI-SDFR-AT-0119]